METKQSTFLSQGTSVNVQEDTVIRLYISSIVWSSTVRIFNENGADVNLRDSDGDTQYCCGGSCEFEVLETNGANLDENNSNEGFLEKATELFRRIRNGHLFINKFDSRKFCIQNQSTAMLWSTSNKYIPHRGATATAHGRKDSPNNRDLYRGTRMLYFGVVLVQFLG